MRILQNHKIKYLYSLYEKGAEAITFILIIQMQILIKNHLTLPLSSRRGKEALLWSFLSLGKRDVGTLWSFLSLGERDVGTLWSFLSPREFR